MLRLYFKKLPLTLAFLVLYFLVFVTVITFVWMHFASVLQRFLDVKFHEDIHYCIILIISLILELTGVYFLRIENVKRKEIYCEKFNKKTYVFHKDFAGTLKSTENLMHTSAYLTITMPFIILIGISSQVKTIFVIIGSVIAVIVEGLSFSVINTLHWCIVHKKWSKQQ